MNPELLFFVPVAVVCLVAGILIGTAVAARRHRRTRTAALAHRQPMSPAAYPDVHELVARGRQIEAIKLYRRRTGVSLAEAKRATDEMRSQQ